MSDKNKGLNVQDITDEMTIVKSISEQIIYTTADRLELELIEFKNNIERKKDILTPFSIMLTTLATLITADFKTFVLSAAVWESIYVITTVLSFLFLLKNLCFYFKSRNKTNVNKVIEKISNKRMRL